MSLLDDKCVKRIGSGLILGGTVGGAIGAMTHAATGVFITASTKLAGSIPLVRLMSLAPIATAINSTKSAAQKGSLHIFAAFLRRRCLGHIRRFLSEGAGTLRPRIRYMALPLRL